jgi:GAF domain-containing protein
MKRLPHFGIEDFTKQNFDDNLQSIITLMTVSEQFSLTFDLDILFQTASNGIVQLTGLDSSAIYLLEDEDIYLAATTPLLPPDFSDEFRRAELKDHPHIKQAIAQNTVISIPDVINSTDLTPAEKEVCDMRNLRSILYFPIQSRDKMEGVLIIASCNEPREIDEISIGLCKTMVHYASIAIINARYRKQLKQYANNLEDQVIERTDRLNFLVDSMAGREIRMAELKKVIAKLRKQIFDLGHEPIADDPLIEQLDD